MSITSVYISIKRHLRNLVVTNIVSEGYVSGELTKVTASGTVSAAIFPLTNRDLRYFPEGAFTFQDKKIFEVGSGTITDKAIVTFDSSDYLVDGGTKRNFEGMFTTYMAKRIADNS